MVNSLQMWSKENNLSPWWELSPRPSADQSDTLTILLLRDLLQAELFPRGMWHTSCILLGSGTSKGYRSFEVNACLTGFSSWWNTHFRNNSSVCALMVCTVNINTCTYARHAVHCAIATWQGSQLVFDNFSHGFDDVQTGQWTCKNCKKQTSLKRALFHGAKQLQTRPQLIGKMQRW